MKKCLIALFSLLVIFSTTASSSSPLPLKYGLSPQHSKPLKVGRALNCTYAIYITNNGPNNGGSGVLDVQVWPDVTHSTYWRATFSIYTYYFGQDWPKLSSSWKWGWLTFTGEVAPNQNFGDVQWTTGADKFNVINPLYNPGELDFGFINLISWQSE